MTEDYSKAYRIPTGVFVDSVVEGEAADKAGIRPRDIITKIGDVTVTTSDMIVDELQYYKAGETVTVTISRLMDDNEYQEIEVSVTLGKRPADLDQQQGSSGQQGSQDNGSDSGNPWRIPGGNR